jgi:acyl carrier protein
MYSMDTITQELLEIINAHLLQRAEESGTLNKVGLLTSLEGDLELSNYMDSLDFIKVIVNIEKKFDVVLQEDLYILTNQSFIRIAEFIEKNNRKD